ncbi:micronuclear linker histone polyprotein-like isoform X2 [Clinocottus analis]|uniref:micronuclear linker histone polyprotein-like isoform X2 n=1 Tax=Clinocottus analis TaxID=304258 RepID=UPI0035C1C5CD
MNPVDWEDVTIRPVQRNLQNVVEDIMEDASRANEKWNTYCKHAGHTVDEAQHSIGENVGWKELTPPSHNFYINNSEVEEPDGEPLQMDEEDPELARKREELRAIEERILLKKAAIALKTVETTSPDFSCNESPPCFALKDRVNLILQQKHPGSFLAKFRSPKKRIDSSSRSNGGLVQDDHPMKLRVKALMQQRYSDQSVLPENRKVPDFTPPPPSQNVTSPDDENGVNKGFQRFLSILNKGVDMDFLSRIVNDDSVDHPLGEERLNFQPPAAEYNLDPTFRRKSQQSDREASVLDSSRTNSIERKNDLHSQERSLSERLSLPDDDEKKNDRSRFKSPSAGKKEKKEEEKSQVDEQHKQLQNILQTLGMSLDVEEMSNLADRTQERLYGKKHDNTRVEQENRQRGSQKPHSKSSSSSSSSSTSSSRSTARSYSVSPSRRRCSHSRESRRMSERGHSRDTSGAGLTCHDGNEDSKEEWTYSDKGEEYPKVIASYQHPYAPNHTYPQPAAHSAFADNISSQDSQYSVYNSGTYSAASNSYWASTQGAIPPSFYTSGCPYSQNTYQHFSGSAVAPNMGYRPQRNSFNTQINLLVNPDLSKSEGQTGSSGNRYLQVVSTKQSNTNRGRCLQTLTKSAKRKRKLEAIKLKRGHLKEFKWAANKLNQLMTKGVALQLNNDDPEANLVKKGEAPQLNVDDPEAKQSEEEKRPPTEVEVKANLRKKKHDALWPFM